MTPIQQRMRAWYVANRKGNEEWAEENKRRAKAWRKRNKQHAKEYDAARDTNRTRARFAGEVRA